MTLERTRWTMRYFALAASLAWLAVPGRALAVCGDGVVDSGEECDDGNTNNNDACKNDCTFNVCGDGVVYTGVEACDDGNTNNYDACKNNCTINTCGDGHLDPGEDCDDGNRVGGDGCAANCTFETARVFAFDVAKSTAKIQTASLAIGFTIEGQETMITSNRLDAEGNYTAVVKADSVKIKPIKLLSFCACVLGGAAKTCGGQPTGRDCTNDDTICNGKGEGDCLFVHGPGNSASGTIGCGANGLSPINSEIDKDHNTHLNSPDPDPNCTAAGAKLDTNIFHFNCMGGSNDGSLCDQTVPTDCPGGTCVQACNGPDVLSRSGDGPKGSALLVNSLAIATISDGGTCATETNTKVCLDGPYVNTECSVEADCSDGVTSGHCVIAKGPDGIPCTADDPPIAAIATVPLTTGNAQASIVHSSDDPLGFIGPGGTCGGNPCAGSLDGQIFNCDALAADPAGGTTGAALGSAFPALDNATQGDLVVTTALAAGPVPPTQTPTNTTLPTPTPTPRAACAGDCDSSGFVTVDELVTGVKILLGTANLTTCPRFDVDGSGDVTVDELVRGVNYLLESCPAA